MNTLIYLWIEPLVMNHERSNEKVYFNCIIAGNHVTKDTGKLDNILEGELMNEIMDFANIDSNWNYAAVSSKTTNKPVSISFADSPETKAINKKVSQILTNKKDIQMTASNMDIVEDGKINVHLPALGVKDTIDFAKIWDNLENNFLGKIQEGDTVKLTDEDGNTVFEMTGGSFLNIGVADLQVKDAKTGWVKGGLFIREDGSIDIGDAAQTFYLKIYTHKLLKASLKLKKSLMDITRQKLLK